MRSLFQRSTGTNSCFIMHDLVNDLAKFVSGDICFRLEVGETHNITEKVRHLSYVRGLYDSSKKFEAFFDAKSLRTFLPLSSSLASGISHKNIEVINALLPTLRCLRVLSVSRYGNISDLPECIGSLRHLRYLDLSHTAIRKLPDSITYNLQTLLLSGCSSLIELPKNIVRLINLRNLDIAGTNIKEMPGHMSRLRSLQILSSFIVSNHNNSTITELREFQLRGRLHILGLQNVVHAKDAIEANLKDKRYLAELVLEWSTETEDSQNERDVLDKLKPHTNLKNLTIKYYGGTRFPIWLGDHSFSNMTRLSLKNCNFCLYLPSLGQLPALKELFIVGFHGVERVGPEFYGNASSAIKPFGSLEILRFKNMQRWEEWVSSGVQGGEFPSLKELYVRDCPRLTRSLPDQLPTLEKLVISNCPQLLDSLPRSPVILEMQLLNCDEVLLRSNNGLNSGPSSPMPAISGAMPQHQDQVTSFPNQVVWQLFSCIEILRISKMSKLKELPPALRWLTIKNTELFDCSSLKSFPRDCLPTTLKSLQIVKCRKLDFLLTDETMHGYHTSLERLYLERSCDSLVSFPLGLFPKLNFLCIFGCENLESLYFSDGLHGELTNLSWLEIWSYPKLACFPRGGLTTPILTFFAVSDCKNLKSLPEQMCTLLPSLRQLYLSGCPDLEGFPEGGLPSNLVALTIRYCNKLMASRMEWGLQRHPSLKHFNVEGRYEEQMESFPEEWMLPSTLTSLTIWSLKLKYLDKRGLQHLNSLQELKIWKCPNLQSIPEHGLPHSLSLLEIMDCPLLKQRCQRDKGEDWPNISRIRCIVIDSELIS